MDHLTSLHNRYKDRTHLRCQVGHDRIPPQLCNTLHVCTIATATRLNAYSFGDVTAKVPNREDLVVCAVFQTFLHYTNIQSFGLMLHAKKAIVKKKYYITSTLKCRREYTRGMWRAMRPLPIRTGSDVKREEGLNMHCMHKDTLTFTCS